MRHQPLTDQVYYHIDNRGNNSRDPVREEKNHGYFLDLCDRSINLATETYAWLLMLCPVIIKDHKWETIDLSACEAADSGIKPVPSRHFPHLFDAYSTHAQLWRGRSGTPVERLLKHKAIKNSNYLKAHYGKLYLKNRLKQWSYDNSNLI